LLFVRKSFCDPNLRGGSPENFFLRKKIFAPPPANILWKRWKKYGKIWHRGNFSLKVIIYETGCDNFPLKNLVTLAPLHLHSKQSRKLARSCFSWRFFAFHSTIYKLKVILLKVDREFFVLGWFFYNRVIGRSEYGDVNMEANTVYVELWLV
jgi:hypothetical protein